MTSESSTLLFESTPSTILALEGASLIFEPDSIFWGTTTALGILSVTFPDLADTLTTFAESSDEIVATIDIVSGVLDGTVTLPDGMSSTFELDTVAVLNDLATQVAQISGAFTLSDGLVTGNLTSSDFDLAVDSFDLAMAASQITLDWLTGIDESFAFEDGEFLIDADTSLGEITGTLGFADGSLSLNVSTPLGRLTGSYDFPPEAVFNFSIPNFGFPLILDLDDGSLKVDLPIGVDPRLPLDSLSGDAMLDDGILTLSTDAIFGTVETQVDLGDTARQWVSDLLTGLSGEITVNAGVVEANLVTDTSQFDIMVDAVDLLNQAAAFMAETDGTVAIADGLVTTSLTTPAGTFEDVSDVDDVFAALFETPLGALVS